MKMLEPGERTAPASLASKRTTAKISGIPLCDVRLRCIELAHRAGRPAADNIAEAVQYAAWVSGADKEQSPAD